MQPPPPPSPGLSRLPGLPFRRVRHPRSGAELWFAQWTLPLLEGSWPKPATPLHTYCTFGIRIGCYFRRQHRTRKPPWSAAESFKPHSTTAGPGAPSGGERSCFLLPKSGQGTATAAPSFPMPCPRTCQRQERETRRALHAVVGCGAERPDLGCSTGFEKSNPRGVCCDFEGRQPLEYTEESSGPTTTKRSIA
jgi:hypothetical protein